MLATSKINKTTLQIWCHTISTAFLQRSNDSCNAVICLGLAAVASAKTNNGL